MSTWSQTSKVKKKHPCRFPANSDLASNNPVKWKAALSPLWILKLFLKQETENKEKNSPIRLRSTNSNVWRHKKQKEILHCQWIEYDWESKLSERKETSVLNRTATEILTDRLTDTVREKLVRII